MPEVSIGQVFNFCTGRKITVRGLADKMRAITGFHGQVLWDTIPRRRSIFRSSTATPQRRSLCWGGRLKLGARELLAPEIRSPSNAFVETQRVQAVPEQKDLVGNAAQEMVNKSGEFGTAGRAAHETKIGMRVGRDGRKGRELGPIETVKQKGSVPPRCPGFARRGQQREAALVERDQRGFQLLGVFFTCGLAPSSRYRAATRGFLQLQPKWWNRRQT